VACLQAQLLQVKAQLAQSLVDPRNIENQWTGNVGAGAMAPAYPNYMNSISPQSSLESIEHSNDGMYMQEIQSREDCSVQPCSRKRPIYNNDLGELQELALRMMRN
jgi:hypothetical protein